MADQGVGVSKQGAKALNKTAYDTYLQTSKSTSAKPEYYALVEMFHQLHCLVSLYCCYFFVEKATVLILIFGLIFVSLVQEPNTSSHMAVQYVRGELG